MLPGAENVMGGFADGGCKGIDSCPIGWNVLFGGDTVMAPFPIHADKLML